MSAGGHEVEDVDIAGPTPWEQDQIRGALVALRRHGYSVTIVSPQGQVVPQVVGLRLVPPAAPGEAVAHDALYRAMLNDGLILSGGRDDDPGDSCACSRCVP